MLVQEFLANQMRSKPVASTKFQVFRVFQAADVINPYIALVCAVLHRAVLDIYRWQLCSHENCYPAKSGAPPAHGCGKNAFRFLLESPVGEQYMSWVDIDADAARETLKKRWVGGTVEAWPLLNDLALRCRRARFTGVRTKVSTTNRNVMQAIVLLDRALEKQDWPPLAFSPNVLQAKDARVWRDIVQSCEGGVRGEQIRVHFKSRARQASLVRAVEHATELIRHGIIQAKA